MLGMQNGKSSLFGKLGGKLAKAAEVHRNDPAEFSEFSGLPAGIENGVAQLVDCKFDQYKQGNEKGEYFFYAAAVVVEPKEYNGIQIEGLRTSIGPEPICDTPSRSRKSMDEHVAWVQNEMKKLGASGDSLGGEDLESTAAALKESQPYVRFRTWQGQKQEIVQKNGKWYVGDKPYGSEAAAKAANPFAGREPRVQHQWNGVVAYESNGQVATDAVDEEIKNTELAHSSYPSKSADADTDADGAEAGLEQLVMDAGSGDEAAQKKLIDLALEAGHPQEKVDEATDWATVAEMISHPAGTPEEAPEEEAAAEPEEPWEPKKEDVYLYKPMDPKTKKPVKKGIECEVTSVDKKTSTVSLKQLDNPKVTYKGIKWEALESAT